MCCVYVCVCMRSAHHNFDLFALIEFNVARALRTFVFFARRAAKSNKPSTILNGVGLRFAFVSLARLFSFFGDNRL